MRSDSRVPTQSGLKIGILIALAVLIFCGCKSVPQTTTSKQPEKPARTDGRSGGPPAEQQKITQGKIDSAKLLEHHELAMGLLQDAQYQEAIKEYKKILDVTPDDATALYNTACAYSLLGEKKPAVEFLTKSVEDGFTDFQHIQSDKDLNNIRDEEAYKELIREKEKYLKIVQENQIRKLKERLGKEYIFEKMDDYKLVVVSNVSRDTIEDLKDSLRRVADAHWSDFFKHKPSYYLTILIPGDMEDYNKKFGGRSGAAGFYSPQTRTLVVNLATGTGTMIHEFTHALHYADMEGLKQTHPAWIIEGFGSLYEQCGIRNGSGYGLLNWRLPILQSVLNTDRYIKWRDIMEGKKKVNDANELSIYYAEVRYIFYYLQEKDLLREFYQKYTQNYDDDDPRGIKVIESLFDKSLEEIEEEWIPWVKELQYAGVKVEMPFLGIGPISEISRKGLIVETVVPDSGAYKAGIKKDDILTEIDGKKTSVFADIQQAISGRKIGDTIKVKILRDGEEKILDVTLGKRP